MNSYKTKAEIERDALYDTLIDLDVATEGEIGVAIHFGGFNVETLNSLLYYKTGYRSLEQWKSEWEDN